MFPTYPRPLSLSLHTHTHTLSLSFGFTFTLILAYLCLCLSRLLPSLAAPTHVLAPGAATPQNKVDYSELATSTPKLDALKGDLSTHKRGLFRRKVSLHNMLSWSRESIPQPMLVNLSKENKRAALENFKLLQQYMGDRNARGELVAVLGLLADPRCPFLLLPSLSLSRIDCDLSFLSSSLLPCVN